MKPRLAQILEALAEFSTPRWRRHFACDYTGWVAVMEIRQRSKKLRLKPVHQPHKLRRAVAFRRLVSGLQAVLCDPVHLTTMKPVPRWGPGGAFLLLCLFAGRCLLATQPVPVPFADACLFHVSFDYGDTNADIAVGDPKAAPPPKDRKVLFQPGLRGQALLVGGESVAAVSYKAAGNFSYVRPGTMSMWIQPVKWKRGEALPPDPLHPDSAGYRAVTYTIFFMAYYAGGYMGVERMTPAYTRHTDSLLFWSFKTPKGPNSSFRALMDWADGDWHHVALTWRGQEISLYVDGARVAGAFLKEAIGEDALGTPLQIGGAAEPTLIDEVSLYSRALSEAEIKSLFASLGKPKPATKEVGP